jgi:hypothetical protein
MGAQLSYIGNDPIMQKFLHLDKTDPQTTKRIMDRAQELLDGELSDSLYDKSQRAGYGGDGGGRGEYPMQTAIKMAMQEMEDGSLAAGLQAREELAPNPTMRSEVDTAGMGSNLTLDKERGIPGNANSLESLFLQPIPQGKEFSIGPKPTTFTDVPGPSNDPGSYFLEGKPFDIQTNREAIEPGSLVPSRLKKIQTQAEAGTQGSMFPTSPNIDIQTQKEAAGAGGFDLGKLLGALGSNTGLTALGIGAQGIGGIMQGRAQSKADKGARRQQRTNNAIAAFTGGQAAQAAPRQANSTGGNILSALGQTLGGVANARRADQATKFDQDLETRKLDAIEGRNNAMIEVAKLQAGAKGRKTEAEEAEEAANLQQTAKTIFSTLDEITRVHANGGLSTGYFAPKLPGFLGGDRQDFLQTIGDSLIGPINTIHKLGRLSDKDLEIIERSIPQFNDARETVAAKANGLRLLLKFRMENGKDVTLPPEIMKSITGFDGTSSPSSGSDAKAAAKAAWSRGDYDEAERIMDEAGV